MTYLKLLLFILLSGIAIYAFYNGIQVKFQPVRFWRILLFSAGFLFGFTLTWLLLPDAAWFILAVSSVVGGVLWSYTMPERWRFLQRGVNRDQ